MRVLLVAVLLGVGGNAWGAAGDKTTNVNLTFDGTATFTNSANWSYTKDAAEIFKSASCWVWANSSSTVGGAIENDGKQLRLSNGNISISLYGAAAGLKDIVTIEFDIAYGGSWSSSEYLSTFIIRDVDGSDIVKEEYKTGTNTNNKIKSSTMGVTQDDIYVRGNSTDWSGKVHFAFTFNYDTKKISLTTTCSSATNKSSDFEIDMPLGTKAVGSFYVSNAKHYSDRGLLLDNIVIKTEEGDYSTTKTFTYSYKDNSDNDITELVTSHGGLVYDTGESGELYTPTYPSSVTDDEYAYDYTYTSGGDAFTVTNDATITLVYTKSAHPTTSVTLQRKTGVNLISSTVLSASYPVGKPITYPVNKYVLYQNSLYETGTVGDPYYKKTIAAAATLTDNYSVTSIGNVVYFSEAEDISGMTESEMGNIPRRLSCGKGGYSSSDDIIITSLPAGRYKLTTLIYKNNSGGLTVTFTYGDGEDDKIEFYQNGATNGTTFYDEFEISETTNIVLKAGTAAAGCLDYIYIQKTGEVAPVSAAGFATNVSTYNLDFTSTATKAYLVKVNSKGIATLTAINEVPAGTPVLLYKEGGASEAIPVIASADAVDADDNDLVAGTGAAVATTDGDYTNMILNNVSGIGFYFANGQTVATNRAYLHIARTLAPDAAASRMVMVFADEATGISATRNDNGEMDNSIYNLNGQRVEKPAKGLYIVNGKKVILK